MRYYKKMMSVLVFVAIFSTVAPASSLATDATNITTSASAVSSTGGQNGADGKDGQDGAPGKNGQDGQDGQSVSSGASSASAHIQTTMNGESVVDIKKSEYATGGGTTSAAAHATTATIGSVPEHTSFPSEFNVASSSPSELQQLLSGIRAFLIHYVEKLF